MRSLAIRALLLVSAAALGPAAASTAAVPGPTGKAAAKAPCSAQKKALRRAADERRSQARERYNACLKSAKEKALATDIRRQLTDQRLVGRRGDGEYVNWLFCANGKYRLESTGASGRGISTGSRWVVTQAKGSSKQWTAVIRKSANLRAGGTSIGIARKASQYYVGIDRGGDVTSQGPVTRTTDSAGCVAL